MALLVDSVLKFSFGMEIKSSSWSKELVGKLPLASLSASVLLVAIKNLWRGRRDSNMIKRMAQILSFSVFLK